MKSNSSEKAVIIGAGPAGLTAAYELLTRSNIVPIVLEKSEYMGGLSRTVEHNGNRIDIGGHRFFSKSDRVMNWWLEHLPLEGSTLKPHRISYHRNDRLVTGNAPSTDGHPCMLVRQRKSRIYFRNQRRCEWL